ncbi:MAG: stage II sporulation protein R [Clostridia bacterium]|nr:stage II sporulation protein R [Clostridia bacterium]
MKKYKFTLYIFILAFFILNITLMLNIFNAKNNIDSYIRLHIVANSDSISDQILKLQVTKNINEYIAKTTKSISDKKDYLFVIQNNIYNILSIAQDTITSNNSNYKVSALIGNIKHEDKKYNNKLMEAGTYLSLKVIIGDGNGENWWTLLYPSLPNELSIEDSLSNENIHFKSKIFELFKGLFD